MPHTSTQPARLQMPHGVRFSLRSVVIAMTVLAIVCAVFAPLIRVAPLACGFAVVGWALGFGAGVWRRDAANRAVLRQPGKCSMELPIASRRRGGCAGLLPVTCAALFAAFPILLVGIMGQQSSTQFWVDLPLLAAVFAIPSGAFVADAVSPGRWRGRLTSLLVCRHGIVVSFALGIQRLYKWDQLRIVFLRNGNVRLRLDSAIPRLLLAEIPNSHREQLRIFLHEYDITYHSDEL